MRTRFKRTETFQYTNFRSCHPPGVTEGFIKGEALKLLRTNSSEITFEENMRNFSTEIAEKHLSEVIFADRKKALDHRNKNALKKILPFHALCSAIPHCVAQPQEHTHGEMAPYTEPTITEKHSLRSLPSFHIAKEKCMGNRAS